MNHRDTFISGIHGQAAKASNSMQTGVAAEAAIPISPVDSAISLVSVNLRDLQATIQRLRARLEPVLMPIADIGKGSQTNPVPAAPAPLVGHIEDLSDQLRESCAALQDLERRLAL
ncbi:hypothetical protein CHL79_27160 [Delftia acidovorans]|uniref:hypothetical protein n=1 Tax=Delftia acidovorans TaxID=80866 RepID=UPI000BC31103|nr:hypothetical protein [Delftia acidovorans]ATH15828.1 hypothetical protein CHL79_27160 [Delftia acidovorans]